MRAGKTVEKYSYYRQATAPGNDFLLLQHSLAKRNTHIQKQGALSTKSECVDSAPCYSVFTEDLNHLLRKSH
jgi:hypothetical protein